MCIACVAVDQTEKTNSALTFSFLLIYITAIYLEENLFALNAFNYNYLYVIHTTSKFFILYILNIKGCLRSTYIIIGLYSIDIHFMSLHNNSLIDLFLMNTY